MIYMYWMSFDCERSVKNLISISIFITEHL